MLMDSESTTRGPWPKQTDNSEICSRSLMSVLPRIKGITYGLANKYQKGEHDGKRYEGRYSKPGCVEVGLTLSNQFTKGRRTGRQAEAKEIQRCKSSYCAC